MDRQSTHRGAGGGLGRGAGGRGSDGHVAGMGHQTGQMPGNGAAAIKCRLQRRETAAAVRGEGVRSHIGSGWTIYGLLTSHGLIAADKINTKSVLFIGSFYFFMCGMFLFEVYLNGAYGIHFPYSSFIFGCEYICRLADHDCRAFLFWGLR